MPLILRAAGTLLKKGTRTEEIHHEEAQAEPVETEEPLAAAAAVGPPVIEDLATSKHWYIIHAYSGFEQKVAESLKTRAQASALRIG